MVLLATRTLTAALTQDFDWLYPVRASATGVALWVFRRVYRPWAWTWSWHALAIGGLVFGLWLLLAPPVDSRTSAVAQGLAHLSGGLAAVWVGFRVLGSVITVPWMSLNANRYFHRFAVTNEDCGRAVVATRRYAANNPAASPART